MTAEVAMGVALIGLVGAALGYWFHEIRHRREMGVKMIEVAVGILAADPEKTKGLRDWAVEALAHYSSDVPLTDDAKAALRSKPLPVFADAAMISAGRAHVRGIGAVGAAGELFETPLPLKDSERKRPPER